MPSAPTPGVNASPIIKRDAEHEQAERARS